MLILESFKKSSLYNTIKAKIAIYLVLETSIRVFKGIFKNQNKTYGNLTLKNIVIIKGFYINIILKAYLLKIGVQHQGYNSTLR